jgi:NTP pyrophosphatase (non-canonical NTP hydrolase)
MTVKEMIKEISKNADWYAAKFDVEVDKEFAAYNLVKEIGQFAEARLISEGKSIPGERLSKEDAKDRMSQELVDIIALAIINANLYDIDIESALTEKWIKKTGS